MQYQDFLSEVIIRHKLTTLSNIYHRVRNIPYGSNGNRDPRIVYESNLGSCSGKHVLLRDLLRAAGFQAEIITMFTYFNESTPVADCFPDELKVLSSNTRVPDFHHYVRVQHGGCWLKLDATWPDELSDFGFRVNHHWAGTGDTFLASVPEHEYPNAEDIASFKVQLVESLPDDDRARRARYFALVTDWIEGISCSSQGGTESASGTI